ncbi:MAG: hypothetical protein IT460_13350 [Planctomycetes bacterium]|nr:hypothetical protein [Planctomycetota bacterium]
MSTDDAVRTLEPLLFSAIRALCARAKSASGVRAAVLRPQFSWGDVRGTAHAVYTLVKCGLPESHPLVQGGCAWIVAQQGEPGGVWSDEAWDTALAVRALAVARAPGFPRATAERAARWLVDLGLGSDPFNLHEELWETTFALRALAETHLVTRSADGPWVEQACRWLLRFQAADGTFVASHYTALAVLAIEETLRAGLLDVTPEWTDALERARASLLSRATTGEPDRLWSRREGWVNGYVLQALSPMLPADSPHDVVLHPALLARCVAWLADRERAGWSDDPEDLSEMILAMRAILARARARAEVGTARLTDDRLREAKAWVATRVEHGVFRAMRSPGLFCQRDASGNWVLTVSPGFRRRALAVAAVGGVVVAILKFWKDLVDLFG